MIDCEARLKEIPEMFFAKKCFYCKRKTRRYTRYLHLGKKVFVCDLCKTYAERRALKKV